MYSKLHGINWVAWELKKETERMEFTCEIWTVFLKYLQLIYMYSVQNRIAFGLELRKMSGTSETDASGLWIAIEKHLTRFERRIFSRAHELYEHYRKLSASFVNESFLFCLPTKKRVNKLIYGLQVHTPKYFVELNT